MDCRQYATATEYHPNMSHQVLARKWRPQTFADIVGQTHVVTAMVNALKTSRLHHAYLFSGTRGVGKTTIARVFAKALSCETGITPEPCGECEHCQSITEGRFVDLIEVDAASRTRVEDTRELLENIQYAPTRGRFKIYLIDEVHMLSGHSFNALLKTLEEPPEHVKFLLATTDPQKLPVTVLSRCLQFTLRHISHTQINEQMAKVLSAENIAFEQSALMQLSESADGSMRDALSLLDQAIAYSGADITEQTVNQMLGTVPSEQVDTLMHTLCDFDAVQAMDSIEKLSSLNVNFTKLLDQMIVIFHAAAISQAVPSYLEQVNLFASSIELMAEKISAEDIQLFYQVAMTSRRDLHLAHSPRAGFEMAVLRMIMFRPGGGEVQVKKFNQPSMKTSRLRLSDAQKHQASSCNSTDSQDISAEIPHSDNQDLSKTTVFDANSISSESSSVDASKNLPEHKRSQISSDLDDSADKKDQHKAQADYIVNDDEDNPHSTSLEDAKQGVLGDWPSMIVAMNLTGLVRELANHCVMQDMSDEKIMLMLSKSHESLLTEVAEKKLTDRIKDFMKMDVALSITVSQGEVQSPAFEQEQKIQQDLMRAQKNIERNGFVQAMTRDLQAQIVPVTIQIQSQQTASKKGTK